jgi:hypothetical protein
MVRGRGALWLLDMEVAPSAPPGVLVALDGLDAAGDNDSARLNWWCMLLLAWAVALENEPNMLLPGPLSMEVRYFGLTSISWSGGGK